MSLVARDGCIPEDMLSLLFLQRSSELRLATKAFSLIGRHVAYVQIERAEGGFEVNILKGETRV